jgi:hypothetical protein
MVTELTYQSCKESESGVSVDIYQNNVFIEHCGSIVTNQGTTPEDQMYRFADL